MLVAFAGIDDDLRPVGVRHVAVLLPPVGVGLVERHAMTALVQRADDAAVVGGRAVPVCRDQARAEERDFQAGTHAAALALPLTARQLGVDGQQLVDAVGARVAREDRAAGRAPPVPPRAPRSASTSRKCGCISAPSRATRKSSPGVNSPSASLQGARDQRDAAGERLEHADGRNARQRRHIRPPRNVHGHCEAREHARRFVVRQPAARTRLPAAARRCRASPDSARRECAPAARARAPARAGIRRARRCARHRPSCRSRRDRLRAAHRGMRLEDARVGGFVPRPRPRCPAAACR